MARRSASPGGVAPPEPASSALTARESPAKRRRSLSPGASREQGGGARRERHDEAYYNDEPYGYGAPPPPRMREHDFFPPGPAMGFGPPFGMGRPMLQPPESFPFLVPFAYFRDFVEQDNPALFDASLDPSGNGRDELAAAYARYKAEHVRLQLRDFAREQLAPSPMQGSRRGGGGGGGGAAREPAAWFREKYSAEDDMVDLRKRTKRQGRHGQLELWREQFKSGLLESLSFDEPTQGEDDDTKHNHRRRGSSSAASKPVAAEDVKMAAATEDEGAVAPNVVPEPTDAAAEADQANGKPRKPFDAVDAVPPPDTLFIKSIPPTVTRKFLEEKCAAQEGFQYVALCEPNMSKHANRVGFVKFATPENARAAMDELKTIQTGHQRHMTIQMDLADRPVFNHVKSCPALASTPERLARDLAQARKVARVFEDDNDSLLASNEEAHETHDGSDLIEESRKLKVEELEARRAELGDEAFQAAMDEITRWTLDQYLYYLRRVFHTCYYCHTACDFQEELLRSCARHVRKLDAARGSRRSASSAEMMWERNLDQAIQLWLDPLNDDMRKHGGEDLQELMARVLRRHVKEEHDDKYRCRLCNKLFAAERFVTKHVSNKHWDAVPPDDRRVLADARALNNFVRDPAHVSPLVSAVDPAKVGGGAMGPGMFMPTAAHGGPPPPFMDPFMAISPAGGPPGFGMAGMPPPFDDFMHAGGPPGPRYDDAYYGPRGGGRPPPPPRRRPRRSSGPPPPPPPDAQLDPRARKGLSSYADLDTAPSGSGGDLSLDY